jgi:hypothetical protein
MFSSKKAEPAEWGVLPGGGSARPSPSSAYGIEETIRLMRSLPVDQHPELVVRVVKHTLESVNVRLSAILAEATKKEQLIAQQIASLSGEITGLEAEIAKRRQAIDQLQQDLNETTRVKERLELAEATGVPAPPAAQAVPAWALPPAIAPSTPPKPQPPPFRPVLRPRAHSSSDDVKTGAVDAKAGAAEAKAWETETGTDDAKPLKLDADVDD